VTLRLRSGVYLAETEYGVALLDERSGEYFNLNPTGAQVLRTLLDGGTQAQAVEELIKEYAVDTGSASRDVLELIGDLRSARLIEQ
jgi:hypothetical protein